MVVGVGIVVALGAIVAFLQSGGTADRPTSLPIPDRPVFTRFEFVRERSEHRVLAGVTIRNPGGVDLTDLWISVVYFDGDRQLRESKGCRVPRLPARESIPLTLEAKQVENFSRYEVVLEEDSQRLVYGGKLSDPTPAFQKAESLKRAPEKSTSGGGLEGGSSRINVEVRGLKWFDRDPLDATEGQAGDVPFLRLAVRRGAKSTFPTGKLRILLFKGDQSFRYVNLDLEDASWSRDAGELTSRSAVPELIAYDALSGELWIGLARVDHSKVTLRADVTLLLEEAGAWEWKGLEKDFTSAPKVADRP
jgi:hypothetical protein